MEEILEFLESRLPELGLDYETYGNYIVGLLDDSGEEDTDWDEVLELLQGSSETHAEDSQVWIDLKEQVLKQHRQLHEKARQKEEQEKQEELQKQQDRLHQELAAMKVESSQSPAEKKAQPMDEAKRALVQRYAYDEDVDDEDEDAPMTNKQVAAQQNLEKAREMRSKKTATKKEQQQGTAKAKQEKVRMKEERRKKATKGERRR